jgi:hypothetical protein
VFNLPRNKRYGNVTGGDTTVIDRDYNETDSAQIEENSSVAVITTNDEVDDAVVDDETDTQFEFSMEPAPEDYQPDRKTPGRQRRPSFFDDKLRDPSVYNQGWQRVPVTSEEHKAAVLRELHRAKLYLNGTGRKEGEPEIGLALDDKQEDAVYFKSRQAQKRTRKKTSNPDSLDLDEADNGDEDYFVDDEDENE